MCDPCDGITSESDQNEDSPRPSVARTQGCDKPVPRYSSFLTQILYSVHYIRLKRGRGPTIGEITSFQKKYFGATGDVHSRVITSVEKAISDGFLLEKDGRHVPVTPLARFHNAGSPQEKSEVLKQMQKVFLYKTNVRRERKDKFVRRDRSTITFQERRTVSKSDIVAILRRIEYVVMDHFASSEGEEKCPEGGSRVDSRRSKRDPSPKIKSSDLRINMIGGKAVKLEPPSPSSVRRCGKSAENARTQLSLNCRSANSRCKKRSRCKRDSSGSGSSGSSSGPCKRTKQR